MSSIPEAERDDALDAYRDHILKAEQKAVQDYDKTLITLSSGAIAISLVFAGEFVGAEAMVARWSLGFAWAWFSLSVTLTLSSFYCSHRALRRTLEQVAGGDYPENPGGLWAGAVNKLNLAAGLSFIFGLLFLLVCVFSNLEAASAERADKEAPTAAARSKAQGATAAIAAP